MCFKPREPVGKYLTLDYLVVELVAAIEIKLDIDVLGVALHHAVINCANALAEVAYGIFGTGGEKNR